MSEKTVLLPGSRGNWKRLNLSRALGSTWSQRFHSLFVTCVLFDWCLCMFVCLLSKLTHLLTHLLTLWIFVGPGELDSKKDSVKSLVHAHVVRLQATECYMTQHDKHDTAWTWRSSKIYQDQWRIWWKLMKCENSSHNFNDHDDRITGHSKVIQNHPKSLLL